MSQNQEIIESKLCAFIDDELDEEGRAEIERHLLANPQHRRLLEELRRTSGLVRSLPRDVAPGELAESFNGQLERSVLLQGLGDSESGSATGTQRWPQLAALAAILVLTVGLAAVVYVILPSMTRRPQIVQSVSRSSTAPSASSAVGGGAQDVTRSVAPHDAAALVRDEATGAQSPLAKAPLALDRAVRGVTPLNETVPERQLTHSAGGNVNEGDSVARLREVAKQAAADPQIAELAAKLDIPLNAQLNGQSGPQANVQTDAAGLAGARAAGLADNAVVMVIRATDPDRARQELKDYFDANRIPWNGAPIDLEKQNEVDKSLGLTTLPSTASSVAGDVAAGDVSSSAPGATTKPAANDSVANTQNAPLDSDAAAGQVASRATHDDVANRPSQQKSRNTTAPGVAGSLVGNANSNAAAGLPADDAFIPAAGSQEGAAGRVFLACRMTRKQADYAGTILSHEGVAEHVQVVAAPLASPQQPVATTLSSTSIDLKQKLAPVPATQDAEAASTTADSAANPATQPAPLLTDALSSATTQPAQSPLQTYAKGAQQKFAAAQRLHQSPVTPQVGALPPVESRDEPVDVVIVLQPLLPDATTEPAIGAQVIAAPTTAPATEPDTTAKPNAKANRTDGSAAKKPPTSAVPQSSADSQVGASVPAGQLPIIRSTPRVTTQPVK